MSIYFIGTYCIINFILTKIKEATNVIVIERYIGPVYPFCPTIAITRNVDVASKLFHIYLPIRGGRNGTDRWMGMAV